jgi:chemotaxis protein methyltransferase CheR
MDDNYRTQIPVPPGGFAAGLHTGMSERDFQRLCRLIQERCGIQIVPGKRTLLEGRIGRRLNQLGLNSYREYCEYLFSLKGMAEELTPMIDAVTTNKTDFFREPYHFEFLRDKALPVLRKLYGAGASRKLNLWSAACSSGEEPYTLAMVLADLASCDHRLQFEILATDISTKVLDLARNAIYDRERVEPIPMTMRGKYLLKSRDPEKALVKIVPELRDKIVFRRLNLMDDNYLIQHPMDVIFCRNVIIYFDRPTQEQIINKLCSHLVPGGYLFMGHAETLTNMSVEVQCVAASTYQKSLKGGK